MLRTLLSSARTQNRSITEASRQFVAPSATQSNTLARSKQGLYMLPDSLAEPCQTGDESTASFKLQNMSSSRIWRSPAAPLMNSSTTSTLLNNSSVDELSSLSPKAWTVDPGNDTQGMTASATLPYGISPSLRSAWECYMSSGSWSEASTAFVLAHLTTTTMGVYSTSLCNIIKDWTPYTLCDGIPRMRYPQFGSDCTTFTDSATWSYAKKTFAKHSPTCTILPRDCSVLASMSGLQAPWGPCSRLEDTTCGVIYSFLHLDESS